MTEPIPQSPPSKNGNIIGLLKGTAAAVGIADNMSGQLPVPAPHRDEKGVRTRRLDVGNAPEQKGLAVFQLLRDFPRREAGTAFRTAVRFSAEGSTAYTFSCSSLTRGRSRQS